jgi:TATA-binding protein-associated factor
MTLSSLGDHDDDVRSVAASCLLPVAAHLVEQLPEALDRVLTVLWSCLSDMKDDLSSSVGAVMDLLGQYGFLLFWQPQLNSHSRQACSI